MPLNSNTSHLGRFDGYGFMYLYSLLTADPLDDVMEPGYFDSNAAVLDRFSRIHVTADSGGNPTHALLVVEDNNGKNVRVRLLEMWAPDMVREFRDSVLAIGLDGEIRCPKTVEAAKAFAAVLQQVIPRSDAAKAMGEAAAAGKMAEIGSAFTIFQRERPPQRVAVAKAYRDSLVEPAPQKKPARLPAPAA